MLEEGLINRREVLHMQAKISYDTCEADAQLDELYAKVARLVELLAEANSLAGELNSRNWELPLSVVLDGPTKGNVSRLAMMADN